MVVGRIRPERGGRKMRSRKKQEVFFRRLAEGGTLFEIGTGAEEYRVWWWRNFRNVECYGGGGSGGTKAVRPWSGGGHKPRLYGAAQKKRRRSGAVAVEDWGSRGGGRGLACEGRAFVGWRRTKTGECRAAAKSVGKSSAERAVTERDLMQWREAVAHGSAGAVVVRPVGVRILVKNALPTEKP